MTYRERFAAALAHQDVDRPPMDLAATDMTEIEGGPRVLAAALGLQADGPPEAVDEAVLAALDIDIRGVGGILTPSSPLARRLSDTEVVDAWGIGYTWNGHHYEATKRPLAGADLAALDSFPWPDPQTIPSAAVERCRQRAQFLYEETPLVVCGRHPCFGVLELGCWMCGYDDFLYRLAAEPDFVHRFCAHVRSYQQQVDERYFAAVGRYLHFTTSGDDFGTQKAPLLSPRMFGELVAPYLRERIEHLRTLTDARIFHHTCGAVYPLIGALIACGVEILNPVQPRAAGMEPWRLKRDFGACLTFHGGIDTQQLLPHATAQQVADETRATIAVLGAGGGYILAAAHTLLAEVPPANVVAMYRAAARPA